MKKKKFDNIATRHFFSSAGLFFAFMFMLTLDDGLADTPRDKIVIF
jgi:dsRNA-gated channel SID-1